MLTNLLLFFFLLCVCIYFFVYLRYPHSCCETCTAVATQLLSRPPNIGSGSYITDFRKLVLEKLVKQENTTVLHREDLSTTTTLYRGKTQVVDGIQAVGRTQAVVGRTQAVVGRTQAVVGRTQAVVGRTQAVDKLRQRRRLLEKLVLFWSEETHVILSIIKFALMAIIVMFFL